MLLNSQLLTPFSQVMENTLKSTNNRRLRIGLLKSVTFGLVTVLVAASASRADILYSHQGLADPTTEGFSEFLCCGPSDAGPLANDLGLDSWRVTGNAQSSQFGYFTQLSASDRAQIGNSGFVLSMNARVIQNLAPSYEANNPVTIAGALVDINNTRFEMALGINSDGDTVVVLPTSVDAGGPGNSIRTPGQFWTLAGSGYHTFDLRFDPHAFSADFYVNGILTSSGYGGHNSFAGADRFSFGAASGGQGNFNSVSLSIVPEPGTMLLLLVGIAPLALRRQPTIR